MSNKTDRTVTIAKAIGITLMVFAHAISKEWLVWRVIYTFHMPLFFMLSGYCFKEEYLTAPIWFVRRKLQGIYVPFLFYSLAFLLLHNTFCQWHVYNPDWHYSTNDYLMQAGKIIFNMGNEWGVLNTFWFLRELLIGNLLFYILLRTCRKNAWIMVTIFVLLSVVNSIWNWHIPFLNKLTFYASTFIALGYAARNQMRTTQPWWVYIGAILFTTIYVLIGRNFEMRFHDGRSIIPYIITAFGGSLCVFHFSGWLGNTSWGKNPILLFIGNHTMEILALHIILFKVVNLAIIKVYDLPISMLEESPIIETYSKQGWWLAYTIIGMVIPLMIAYWHDCFKCLYEKKRNTQ